MLINLLKAPIPQQVREVEKRPGIRIRDRIYFRFVGPTMTPSLSEIGWLLSRRSREQERLNATGLSICLSPVRLLVCLSPKCKNGNLSYFCSNPAHWQTEWTTDNLLGGCNWKMNSEWHVPRSRTTSLADWLTLAPARWTLVAREGAVCLRPHHQQQQQQGSGDGGRSRMSLIDDETSGVRHERTRRRRFPAD